MKYTKQDLLTALEKAHAYHLTGEESYAKYWELHAERIANWLEAKKARSAKRRELKKAGLWKNPEVLTPTPISPDSITLPKLNWDTNPSAALVAFTRMVLDAEGAGKCEIQVHGHRRISFFRWPANYIRFSLKSISDFRIHTFREYSTVKWVLQGMANQPGEVALKLLALHEAAHAIDFAQHGFTHHHGPIFQHILLGLLKKYAQPAYSISPVFIYA